MREILEYRVVVLGNGLLGEPADYSSRSRCEKRARRIGRPRQDHRFRAGSKTQSRELLYLEDCAGNANTMVSSRGFFCALFTAT